MFVVFYMHVEIVLRISQRNVSSTKVINAVGAINTARGYGLVLPLSLNLNPLNHE